MVSGFGVCGANYGKLKEFSKDFLSRGRNPERQKPVSG